MRREAYVFTYPLVMNYRTMYIQAIEGDRRFGEWVHLGLSSPTDFDNVTPNNDTPYSYAWLDLRVEPWVLTMPTIEPKMVRSRCMSEPSRRVPRRSRNGCRRSFGKSSKGAQTYRNLPTIAECQLSTRGANLFAPSLNQER